MFRPLFVLALGASLLAAPSTHAQLQCGGIGFNTSFQIAGNDLVAQIQVTQAPGSRPFLLVGSLEPANDVGAFTCLGASSLFVLAQGMTDPNGNVAFSAPLPSDFEIPDLYLSALVAPGTPGPVPAAGPVAIAAKKKPAPCSPLAGISVRKVPNAAGLCEVSVRGKFCPGVTISIELTTKGETGNVTTPLDSGPYAGGIYDKTVTFPCPPKGSSLRVKVDGVTFLWPIRW